MFCENCGTKNEGSNKFCEKCGKELKQGTSKKFDLKSFDYKGFFEKNKVACIAGAAVVVVLVCLLLFTGSSPEKVTDKFFKALQKGDADTVVELLNFEKYEDDYDLDEEDIEKFADKLVDSLEEEDFDYKILKTTEKSKSAKVKVKIEEDDDDEKITVYLNKVDGKWKIDPKKTFGSLY